jgi:hypothetical protein
MKVRRFKLVPVLAGVFLSVAALAGMIVHSIPDDDTQRPSDAGAPGMTSTPAKIDLGSLPPRSWQDLQNFRSH